MWISIHEPTLTGPNVFRMLVPGVIENFVETITPKDYEYLHLHAPSLKISKVAGIRGASASWDLTAITSFREPLAHFRLRMGGKAEAFKRSSKERRLIIRSPSGAVLKEFGWQRQVQKTDYSYDDESDADSESSPSDSGDDSESDDYEPLGTVTMKDATEKGWIFDGALHVCADIVFEFMDEKRRPLLKAADACTAKLVQTIRRNLDNPPFSDFVIISSDGQRIKTHKLLLASVSPDFRAMFDTDCKETRQGFCEIEDVDGEPIKALLACVLGKQKCNFGKMGLQLLQNLAAAANKYQILPLKADCQAELAPNISLDNVFDILLFADKHSLLQLRKSGFVFLEDNTTEEMLEEVENKLKKMGEAANQPIYDEYLDHIHLRKTGESRTRTLGAESGSPGVMVIERCGV